MFLPRISNVDAGQVVLTEALAASAKELHSFVYSQANQPQIKVDVYQNLVNSAKNTSERKLAASLIEAKSRARALS